MQLLPETAAHSNRSARVRGVTRRLYDPAYNVRVGSAYLAILLKEFDGHPEMALAAYNAGDSRVRDWLSKATFPEPLMFLESIPISETRIYVEMVLRDAEIYRQLLSDSPRFAECKP
jgi:soluble lytic murein transglycosylase